MEQPYDCIVIGGGPAGLTAAIYLARFHLRVRVIDGGRSRAALIPKTRNHAGYPGGIAGAVLVDRMRAQAEEYGARIEHAEALSLQRDGTNFVVRTAGSRYRARAVLLATGVVNNRPAMDDDLHDRALAGGQVRYCPICDGYEVTDQRVGVIGTGERGMKEAIFLRGYTRDLTLIAPDGAHVLDDTHRKLLEEAGIRTVDGPATDFALAGNGIAVSTPPETFTFASVYPAMGSTIRSELATAIGVDATDEGCLTVDAHHRTSIPGLYAAGDVVQGLDQISHAMGGGGVAATTIRNDLAERAPLYR